MAKFIFTHIPKTAGTSVIMCIEKQGYRDVFYDRRDGKFTVPGIDVTFHHHPPGWFSSEVLARYKKYKSFAVARNPYHRAMSQYFMRARCNYEQLTARGMNAYLQEHCKPGNLREDGHFIPQYHYCYQSNGEQVVDHILKFENLSVEFANLMREWGLGLKLNRRDGVARHSCKLTVKDLDKRTIDLINSTYSKDFEAFGYEKVIRA